MMIQSVWKNLTGLQKAAEHLWCDFKWATNSSPNTNDLCIHYMDKSTGTPSLEEKKTRPNCDIKYINVLKNCICNSFEVYEITVPICTSHCIFCCVLVIKSHTFISDCISNARDVFGCILFCVFNRTEALV